MSFPVASRWRYDYDRILACRCVQAGTVIKHEVWGRLDNVRGSYNNLMFHGETRKMAAMPRPRCLTKTHRTFHREGPSIALPKFDLMNSVGGVRSSMETANRQK